MFNPGAIVGILALANRHRKGQAVVGDLVPLGRMVLFVSALIWAAASIATTSHTGAVVSLAFLVFIFPATTIRLSAIPLGLPRLAWLFDRLSGGDWRPRERAARAVLLAARALRPGDESGIRFVERRLDRLLELRVDGVFAAALAARARGNLERYRLLCAAIAGEPRGKSARELLAFDAAERAAWHELLRLRRPRAGRLVDLLVLVAARHVGPGRPSRSALVWAWLLAPRRLRTWRFVSAARRVEPPPPVGGDAFAAHRALLHRGVGAATTGAVALVCVRTDDLREDKGLVASIERRALALGVSVDALAMRDDLVRGIEDDLAQVVTSAELSLADVAPGPTGDAVRQRVHDDRFARLETLVRDVKRRTVDRARLPEADEWCALEEIRALAMALSRDAKPEERAAVFGAVYAPVTSHGVYIENVRGRRFLSQVTFRWLLEMARGGGTRDQSDLLWRNARSCDSDRLPRANPMPGERLGGGAPGNARLLALAVVFAVLFGSLSLAFAPMGKDRYASAAFFSLVGSLVFVGLVFGRLQATEASLTPDGLFVQRPVGAWYVPYEDIASVAPSRFEKRTAVVRLRRTPAWLGRKLAIVGASAEDARSVSERIDARRKR